ncbi:hypothetical protein FA95DRAFT_1571707 [Auriscalpium vulgare]|uniref:Uncharacterized protein n=1 Tax=Auriscalpium vulgare TaxID=40419 RepID=A0ACB8RYZ2_9AGAM|nr:hypothetical protein FA95DRAFT_1571707 [Auriscalpium vulgare]
MKGCLKHSIVTPPPTRSPSPPRLATDASHSCATPDPQHHSVHFPTADDSHDDHDHDHDHEHDQECARRKSVSFCSLTKNQVFYADEWDRSPMEVTPRLSYQDMLELKEIQRSLPRASQPMTDPDLPTTGLHGAPRPMYLRTVPIALLPLISEGSPSNQPPPPPSRFALTASPSEPSSRTSSPLPLQFSMPASAHTDTPHVNLPASISRRSHTSTASTVNPGSLSTTTTTTTTTTTSITISHPPSPPSTPPPPPRLPYNFPPPPPPQSTFRPPIMPARPPSEAGGQAWHGWAPPRRPAAAVAQRVRPKFQFLPLLDSPVTPTEAPEAERQTTPTAESPSQSGSADTQVAIQDSQEAAPEPEKTVTEPPEPPAMSSDPSASFPQPEASAPPPAPEPVALATSAASSYSYFNIPPEHSAPPTPQLTDGTNSPTQPAPSLASPSPSLPMSALAARMAHVRLAALPSPALPPPSPLSLYPPSPDPSAASTATLVSSTITTTTTTTDGESITSTARDAFVLRRAGPVLRRSASVSTGYGTEGEESEAESSVVHTEAESDGEGFSVAARAQSAPKASAGGDAVKRQEEEEDEGEMTLVVLESGELGFVRVRR